MHRPDLLLVTVVAIGLVAGQSAALGQTFPDRSAAGAVAGRSPVLRHNPVFGLGPQTIWRGGFGVEIQGERTRRKGATEEERLALHAALLYGITEDVNIALALPLVQRRSVQGLAPGVGQVDRDATGVGDAIVRAKWRFFHKFSGTTQFHAAVIGGVKVPLGNQSSDPPLGSGSIDFLAGATISRDALRSYLWTSALLRVNGEAFGIKRGKEYRYDAAVGLRPWIPTYTGLDLLLLVELNGVTADRLVVGGVEQAQTGGTILALSPGFWLTRRNWALKGGLKLPVLQDLRGDQPELDYTVVLAIETHM
jgi:Putative MetA-pathway of phenol degradation